MREEWFCALCKQVLLNPNAYKDHICKCDKPQPPFRVGDLVSWCGAEGVVALIEDCIPDEYPVAVRINEPQRVVHFTLDGKYQHWHREPSLKLVSRPKKKVTRQVEAYVQVDKKGIAYRLTSPGIFEYTGDTSSVFGHQIVKLCGSYETEEE